MSHYIFICLQMRVDPWKSHATEGEAAQDVRLAPLVESATTWCGATLLLGIALWPGPTHFHSTPVRLLQLTSFARSIPSRPANARAGGDQSFDIKMPSGCVPVPHGARLADADCRVKGDVYQCHRWRITARGTPTNRTAAARSRQLLGSVGNRTLRPIPAANRIAGFRQSSGWCRCCNVKEVKPSTISPA